MNLMLGFQEEDWKAFDSFLALYTVRGVEREKAIATISEAIAVTQTTAMASGHAILYGVLKNGLRERIAPAT